MKISTSILFASLFVSMCICSCKKDEIDLSSLDTSTQTELEHKKDLTKFAHSCIVWMADKDKFSEDFAKRVATIKSQMDNNDLIVFAKVENVAVNIERIRNVYKNGGAILFVKPDLNELASMMKEYGWGHMYPTSGEYLFYGISKNGSYSLKKPVTVSPTPIVEPISGAEAKYQYTEEDCKGESIDPYADYDPTDPAYYIGPLVKWVNGVITPYTKANTESSDICQHNETIVWDCDLFVHKCAGSSEDKIKGKFIAGVVYKYTPLFCQNSGNGSAHGDFYSFSADYTADPSNIWKGDDVVNKHGGISVHIKGAFMKNVEYKSYISGDGNYPFFYCQPQPQTDNNQVQYEEVQDFNLSGGVSKSTTSEGGEETETTKEHSFSWGYTNSSTVARTVSDVSVANNSRTNDATSEGSVGSSAAWTFLFGNLPTCKGDKGFSGNCTQSAHSYQSFPTQWVWCSKSQIVGSTKSIGKLVTVIHPVLGGLHNGYCVDGEENTWDLGSQQSSFALAVPNRTVFGTARIMNDLGSNYVMHDFVIKSHETGKVVIRNSSDYIYNSDFEFSLAVGDYEISVKLYDKDTYTDKEYVLSNYVMKQRYSESDISTIDFTRNFKEK